CSHGAVRRYRQTCRKHVATASSSCRSSRGVSLFSSASTPSLLRPQPSPLVFCFDRDLLRERFLPRPLAPQIVCRAQVRFGKGLHKRGSAAKCFATVPVNNPWD